MATTELSRFLALMRQAERDIQQAFRGLTNAVTREITRRADADGGIPITKTLDVQTAVAARIISFFLASDPTTGERNPFIVRPDGSVFPLSPFMRALWSAITAATRLGVERHNRIIQRQLPPDVLSRLRMARRNPFTVAERIVSEQETLFRPNPLAAYDPPHLWVDANGYTLSERVWNTAGNTRRKVDAFLQESIAQGRGALDIAEELEQFLLPGRQLIRTRAPYGIDASFDAMRLARTEVTRAAAQANEMSALMNPFIEGVSVVLSFSHPKPDICDDAAAASPFPKDQIPAQYQIPLHPHCLCHYQYEMAGNKQEVLDSLREDIRSTRAEFMDMVGPALVEQFTQALLRGSFQLQDVAVF